VNDSSESAPSSRVRMRWYHCRCTGVSGT
jgi:hypothetical protein